MAAATTSSPTVSPLRLVGRDDEAGSFVSGRDELEEQVGRLRLERDVADLVDDDERVAAEAGELGLQAAVAVGVGEAGDLFRRGREQDAVPALAGPDREPGGQVGLAGSPGPRKTTFSRR